MEKKIKPLYVTQPYLPPLDELLPYLQKIWKSKTITNSGPLHQELENALCEFLGVEYISLFNNGTNALITALQALEIHGEVITTPFSFVATAHSLLWNNITPVFVDIDPVSFNINPKKIEEAITKNTTAIMPVHCYGHPCDTEQIEKISKKYQIKVIYDAAHAFGVKCHCGSILEHGDLSVLSFHATKVFNTFEGGAIVSHTPEMKAKIDLLKNFGFVDEVTVNIAGINGKMNEVSSAMGLLQLKYINSIIKRRKEINQYYCDRLKHIPGIELHNLNLDFSSNFSYFPIIVKDSFPVDRDSLYEILKKKNIYTRRYFYPLITDFSMYKKFQSADEKNLPVAKMVASSVLCLPIYPDLTQEDLDRVIEVILGIEYGNA